MNEAKVGFCPAERRARMGCYGYFAAQPLNQTPLLDPSKGKDPHNHVLAKAREVHQQAFEATHLLEKNIDRLSHVATRARSASCQCFHTNSYSRRWPRGGHLQSPCPTKPKKHVTFWDQGGETSSKEDPLRQLLGQATGGDLEEYDLGPLPTLEPELESFLEAPTPMQGAGDRCDSQPEPSIENYEVWLEWWAYQGNTPDLWGELVTIPNVGNPERLAHKICASFEILWVRSKALRDSNSYTMPPAPKCLQRKMFLPVPDPHLPCQDYHLKQPLRTLAYT